MKIQWPCTKQIEQLNAKIKQLEKTMSTFATAIAQLTTDVNSLIAQEGNEPAAIAAAVAAKDAQDAAAVSALDATVVAALVPAAPAPAPATPAVAK